MGSAERQAGPIALFGGGADEPGKKIFGGRE